jgi:hypothetical protein
MKLSWPNLKYYPVIFLEGLRKTSKASIKIADDKAVLVLQLLVSR